MRDDSGVFAGYTVPNFYDPMISKLSVWAPSRPEAIARMKRALAEYVVKGITTNVRYLRAIMDHPEFAAGDYDTGLLSRAHAELLGTETPELTETALLASAVYALQRDQKRARTLPSASGQGQQGGPRSPWRSGLRRSSR